MFPFFTTAQLFDSVYAEQAYDPRKDTGAAWLAANGSEPTAPKTQGGGLSIGDSLFLAGAAAGAVGAVFEVRSAQSRLKTQSLSLQHESAISAITAREAEVEAQSVLEGADREIGALTAQAGAEKGARRAVMAGRGVQLGVGSTAEVQASGELIKELDVMAIKTNAARAAAGARTRGVNARNSSMFAAVSARNARRSAGNDLTSAAAGASSLLFSGSRLGAQWATDRYRYRT